MPLILFSSPKGGVGKTTLAAHIAAILAARGRRVLALDLDSQNALRLHFGRPLAEEDGLVANLRPGVQWRDYVVDTAAGVGLLPFGATDPVKALRLNAALLANGELLTSNVHDMLRDPNTILIADTSPGPSAAAAALVGMADLTLVVLLADAASACMIPPLIAGRVFGRGTLGDRLADRAMVVLNQVDLGAALDAAVLDSVSRMLGPRLLGAVCWDDTLSLDLAEGRLQTEGEDGAVKDLMLLADAIEARAPRPRMAPTTATYSAFAEWGIA